MNAPEITVPTQDQIANALEREAYRIRTSAVYQKRRDALYQGIQNIVQMCDGPNYESHSSEDMRMKHALKTGQFNIVSLTGRELPSGEVLGETVYTRKFVMDVFGARFVLQYNQAMSEFHPDAMSSCSYDETHDATAEFLRRFPATSKLLKEYVFEIDQPDAAILKSPLGDLSAKMLESLVAKELMILQDPARAQSPKRNKTVIHDPDNIFGM